MYQFVLDSDLETVESLVAGVSRVALSCPAALDSSHKPAFESVTVRVAKPSALLFADSAEIQITRSPRDLEDPVIVSKSANSQSLHYAVLALGANLGDRIAQIELALSILEANGILVLDTSYMYETAAMYVESQPNFANAACLVMHRTAYSTAMNSPEDDRLQQRCRHEIFYPFSRRLRLLSGEQKPSETVLGSLTST